MNLIIREHTICFSILLMILACLINCSDNRSTPTIPDTHAESWMISTSADFHGKVVLKSGSAGCKKCHGSNLDGDITEVSCIECHAERTDNCTGCHGGEFDNTGAPPQGLRGETSDTTLAVGAHTAHLDSSGIGGPINCNDCHIIPDSLFAPGHFDSLSLLGSVITDSVAEITWGTLAGNLSVWDRNAGTCSQTYCHGNFDGGYSTNAPNWAGQSQALCGSCHDDGTNPSDLLGAHAFHVDFAGLKCTDCHASVVDIDLNIVDRSAHVNGTIDTLTRDASLCQVCHGSGVEACTMCHGGVDNQTGAPPNGLRGETSDTTRAVGSHTAHLDNSGIGGPLNCNDCHIVPDSVFASGHFDSLSPTGSVFTDSVAELSWSPLAGNASVWDRNAGTCSQTYCHGNFTGGYSANTPAWTGQSQALCGSCHDDGTNPADLRWKHEYHIEFANLKCADCHASVVDVDNKIIDLSAHINGIIDTLTRDENICQTCHSAGVETCAMCHGGTDNQTGAPPEGLRGETATTQLAVGAHTTHVEGSYVSDSIECSDCHTVPTEFSSPGHYDPDSVAELNWSTLAGNSSVWDRNTGTCSQTYCHGNFNGGYSANAPNWTGPSQALCGSCHDDGTNPADLLWKHEYHIGFGGLQCADCHASVVDMGLNIIDRTAHVNGVVDTLTRDNSLCEDCHGSSPAACNRCHGGTDNQTGAPPKGLRGETSTTLLAVGAHTTHVEGSYVSDPFECSDCHIVPTILLSPGHYALDSVAELTWSSLAGNSSVWDRNTKTCSQVYCHGNFTGGYSANTPNWTGPAQALCGSCHDDGANPDDLSGKHKKHVDDKGYDCRECHSTVVDIWLNIIGKDKHVDGENTISFLASGNFSDSTCTGLPGGCHGTKNWYD